MIAGPCFVYLYSTKARLPNDPQFSGGYCNRTGSFGVGAGFLQGAGFGPLFVSNYQTAHVAIAAIDPTSSLITGYQAPIGSTVYSPTTSLIEYASNQDLVKKALGLDNGVFALSTNPDLTTYDFVAAQSSGDSATRAEGARVAAANLRAMVPAVAIGSFTSVDPYFSSGIDYRPVGEFIGGRNTFLFDNATMSQLLGIAYGSSYRPEVISAAAHLVNAYAAAIPVQVSDEATAGQFVLGLYGYLRPKLFELAQANSLQAASDVQAITSGQIIADTQIFREKIAFPTTGLFFPSPKFFTSTTGTLTLRADDTGDPGRNGSMISTDLYANGASGAIGFFASTSSVQSVTVPAAKAGEVSASLAAGIITVNAVGGFTGTTYFDYAVRHPSGETGTARVYIRFR